jgi:hypothetical protein
MIPAENEKRLESLFRAYRDACEFGDGAPDFMPRLWQRIETRRTGALFTQRLARIFAASTVALAVLAGVAVSLAPQRPLEDTWVEAIANHNLEQNVSYYEPVRLSPAATETNPADSGRD